MQHFVSSRERVTADAHLIHRRRKPHPRNSVLGLDRMTRRAAHRHSGVHVLAFLKTAMAFHTGSRRRIWIKCDWVLVIVGLGREATAEVVGAEVARVSDAMSSTMIW